MSQLQQPQQESKYWKLGIKEGIAFCNLSILEKYEPQTYALFKQPLEEGARVSTQQYDYRIKHHSRFGWNCTRFTRAVNQQYNSPTPTTATVTDTHSIFERVRDRRESTKQQEVNELVATLGIIEDLSRKLQNLSNEVRTQLRSKELII